VECRELVGFDLVRPVEAHRDFVSGETLADSVTLGSTGDAGFAGEVGEGDQIRVLVARS
jgi:isoleucyl-tRNA synthetase